jgi:septal ring-binding cell division protein DamX
VPTILKQGGVLIGHPQQINVGYAKIFATGHFMSACRRWNEKPTIEKTLTQFKSHLAAAHRQHKQMQGESSVTAGYHSTNAAVTHNEDHMAEAAIGSLANIATATAADRGVVAALTQANSRLAKQLEDNSNELRELKALLKKERSEKRGQRNFNPSSINYCWTHGYKVGSTHTSLTCKLPKPGHKMEATRADNMGGSQANRE